MVVEVVAVAVELVVEDLVKVLLVLAVMEDVILVVVEPELLVLEADLLELEDVVELVVQES